MAVPARGRLDKTTSTYLLSGAATAWRAGRVVNSSGAPVVRQCTTAGEQVDGFFLFDGVDGDYVTLSQGPFPRVEAGGAFNPGDKLMTGTDGRLIAYSAGTGVSVAAEAESASSGAGVFVIVRYPAAPSAAAA